MTESNLQFPKENSTSYLTPYEHGAEHDLEAVEEVVPYDDDSGSSGGPSLTRADGFDARGGC